MGEIDVYPIVDNLTVDDFPKIHIPDFNAFARGRNSQKFAAVRGLLASKGCGPFAHIKTCFVDTDLVRKGRLERALPIVLKFL